MPATFTVFRAVLDVIDEWDAQPKLRPTEDDSRQQQARRGQKGRETQLALAARCEAQVMAFVADGVSNSAEIARQLGIHRSTVSRTRDKADAARPDQLQHTTPTVHSGAQTPPARSRATVSPPSSRCCPRWAGTP